MRISIARRRGWLVAVMGIALLIASVMTPGPSGATMMEYTYTGTLFYSLEGTFPSTPAIGTHVTISFLHNGVLPIGIGHTPIPQFTMSCGDLHLPPISQAGSSGYINSVDAAHLPTEWFFWVYTSTGYSLHSRGNFPGSPPFIDYATYAPAVLRSQGAGAWAANPVPLPPAALLLGSGLIPLWWYRRRKTSAT